MAKVVSNSDLIPLIGEQSDTSYPRLVYASVCVKILPKGTLIQL